MIFLSVGTQLGFDRLVGSVDQWVGANKIENAFAQIAAGEWLPSNFEWSRFVSEEQYAAQVRRCRLLVAHAGMGSVLTAIDAQKPLVVMPRIAALGEHRNDHQLDIVEQLREFGVVVVRDSESLWHALDNWRELSPPERRAPRRARELSGELRKRIDLMLGAKGENHVAFE